MIFHKKKRSELLAQIEDKSIVLLTSGTLIKKSADENYPFSVNRNFYYLTGVDEADVILLMIKNKEQNVQELYIKKPDLMMEKWVGKTISKEEAKKRSMIDNVLYLDELSHNIEEYVKNYGLKNVYIDDESNELFQLGQNLLKKFSVLKGLHQADIYHMITKMRAIKTEEEIEAIKKAISITDKGINRMLDVMQTGIYENELEAYFDHELKDQNVKRAFTTIAAGGNRATVLHYIDNDQVINDNEMVLFDLGAAYKHYCADISRTFPINGVFTPRQKEIYEVVLLAQKNVIAAIKPGVTLAQLQDITVETYRKELKRIGLIEADSIESVRKYYYHGVSHSLGLDTHDVGIDRDEPLRSGNIITVEPGLYIEEEQIGIRIEDDVLVTDDGATVLSDMIIKEIIDIENYFRKKKV